MADASELTYIPAKALGSCITLVLSKYIASALNYLPGGVSTARKTKYANFVAGFICSGTMLTIVVDSEGERHTMLHEEFVSA